MSRNANDDLEYYLIQTQNILDLARVNAEMTLYMYNPKTATIFRLIESSPFLNNIRTSCKRISIIETYKLISKSKHDIHSFYKLFEKLEPFIDKNTLEQCETKFNDLTVEIETIKLLRNKVYGHRDTEYKPQINYNFPQVRNLIIDLQKIFSKIIRSLEFAVVPQYLDINIDNLNGKNFFEELITLKIFFNNLS